MGTVAKEEGQLQTVKLDLVKESALNTRKVYDPTALKELAASITASGILTPLLVRPVSGRHVEIAAGSRRYRAAKLAGLTEVPCIVRVMDDAVFQEAVMVENLQREDLTVMEEVEGFLSLIEKSHLNIAEVAARLGKDRTYVGRRITLGNLVEPAKKALAADILSVGHALALSRLQAVDQATVLKANMWKTESGWQVRTVGEFDRYIAHNIMVNLKNAPWMLDDADLVPTAGPCTICPKRTGTLIDLFPDVKATDTCTDPKCYATKSAAWLDRQKRDLVVNGIPGMRRVDEKGTVTEKAAKVVELATSYTSGQGLRPDRWHKATKKCLAPVAGLIVEGTGFGTSAAVCIDPKCKANLDSSERGRSAQSVAAGRATRAKQKQAKEEATRQALLRGLVAKVADKAPLNRDDLRLVARSFLNEMNADDLNRLGKVVGVDITPSKYGIGSAKPALLRLILKGDRATAILLAGALIGTTVILPGMYKVADALTLADLRAAAKRWKATPIEAPKAAPKKKPVKK